MGHAYTCKRLRPSCLCNTCRHDNSKCCEKMEHDPRMNHCPMTICADYQKEAPRQEAT